MSKFHINKHGVPAPCRATKGNCPLGGASGTENHFDSAEQAQAHVDKLNSSEFGHLPGMTSSGFNPKDPKLASRHREAEVVLNDGETHDGIVMGVDEANQLVKFREGFTGKHYDIPYENIDSINVNEDKADYEKNLREQEKPKMEFRYPKEELDKMKGKFVQLEYDGEKFDGEVRDVNFNDRKSAGLIVEAEDGETKYVQTFKLNSLEVTGSSLGEHNYQKETQKVENFVMSEGSSYVTSDYEIPETSDTEMYEQVDSYINAVIRKENGENIDLSKASSKLGSKWVSDVEDAGVDAYGSSSDGGQNLRWDSSSESAYEEDLGVAEKAEEHFHSKVELIDAARKRSSEVDWSKHGKTQQEGIRDTMQHLLDSNAVNDL